MTSISAAHYLDCFERLMPEAELLQLREAGAGLVDVRVNPIVHIERHLDKPDTVVLRGQYSQAWGRKPN